MQSCPEGFYIAPPSLAPRLECLTLVRRALTGKPWNLFFDRFWGFSTTRHHEWL